MEQQLLQDMIRERDARIAKIEKQLDRQQTQFAKLSHNLADVRVKLAEDSLVNRQTLQRLNKAKEAREMEFGRKEKHIKQQSGSLHTYTEMVKLACGEQVTSSYVTRAQAQLCRAMHTMGALEHQVVLVEDRCSKLIKSLKEAVAQVVEEKTKMELEVMNELVVLDDSKRELEEKYKKDVGEQLDELVEIRKQVKGGANNSSSDSEEEDEESVDEEEEEMRELVEQGKLEIKRVEEENAEDLEKIELLRKTLKERQEKKKAKQNGAASKEQEGEEEEADERPQLDKEEKVDVGGES